MAHGSAHNQDSGRFPEAPSGEQSTSTTALQSPLGHPLVTVGFLAIALPLFFHLTVSQTVEVGATHTVRTLDYVAIGGGVVAASCGTVLLLKVILGRGAATLLSPPGRIAAALFIGTMGILHLLRGLGLIKLGLLG